MWGAVGGCHVSANVRLESALASQDVGARTGGSCATRVEAIFSARE